MESDEFPIAVWTALHKTLLHAVPDKMTSDRRLPATKGAAAMSANSRIALKTPFRRTSTSIAHLPPGSIGPFPILSAVPVSRPAERCCDCELHEASVIRRQLSTQASAALPLSLRSVDGAVGSVVARTSRLHVARYKYASRGETVMVTTHAELPCEPRLGSIRALPPCPPGSR